jgi:SAM-dependent methyltransferase
MIGMGRLCTLPGRLLVGLLNRLPQGRLESLIIGLAGRRAADLPADGALRFLFRLDAALYPLTGRYAVAHGGGTHTKHRHTRYHDFFVERLAPDERVLDIGCGNGLLAFDMAARAGVRVVGLDIDADKIADARARHVHPNLEFRIGDAAGAPLRGPEGPFDTVVLSNVLEHLRDRPELLKGLRETLRPARFLIRVPLFERDWRVPLKKELGVEWRLDPTHETEYTLDSFDREMAEAGLEITHRQVRWGEIWAEVRPR